MLRLRILIIAACLPLFTLLGCSDDRNLATSDDSGGFLKDPCSNLEQWKDYEGVLPNMDRQGALDDVDMNKSLRDDWIKEHSQDQ